MNFDIGNMPFVTLKPLIRCRYKAARIIKDLGGHTAKGNKPDASLDDSPEAVVITPIAGV